MNGITPHPNGRRAHVETLADFSMTPRVMFLAVIAICVGVMSAFVALALLRLIGFFTNLFFFQRLGTSLASPADNTLGIWVIVVPVVGALIIGFMARYGSEKIRGHGIPEALEAILINGSRMEPRVAILKPLSSAISIGSGGPFGAEGPIIMTGGAFGSLIGQCFHLSSVERKTLLVAGAAGGMSATFAAPVAAVLLAVELLLFEWKPRSLIPVALSSAAAMATRRYLLGSGPLFPMPANDAYVGVAGLASCVLVGVLAGVVSAALTASVYASEDAFGHLPIHWMWWPVIGGLAIGLGGFVFPEALGVGYTNIGSLLSGEASMRLIVGILVVKSLIWSISLGSGTSGGVLAPLLMIGGALGGLEAKFLPFEPAGFWALVSMAAVLGGTMRAPFTAVIFSLELTHNVNALMPLIVAVVIAYAFTVLVLRRSILTEKVSRRGYHIKSEYGVDPLELSFVRDLMSTSVESLQADARVGGIAVEPRGHRLLPVVDEAMRVVGVLPRRGLLSAREDPAAANGHIIDIAQTDAVIAFPTETARAVAHRMAEAGVTVLPVVSPVDGTLCGLISLEDLLGARSLNLQEEHEREQVFRLIPRRQGANGSRPEIPV